MNMRLLQSPPLLFAQSLPTKGVRMSEMTGGAVKGERHAES